MTGVLFIVTIPTEKEERELELNEQKAKYGHGSKDDISTKESEKFEYGTFKIVRSLYHLCSLSGFWAILSHFIGKLNSSKFMAAHIMPIVTL